MLKIPDRDRAEEYLLEGYRLNPGPWAAHSRYTAQAAAIVAQQCPGIEAEYAYVLGMLHDIGRREGIYKMRHSIDGYRFLVNHGYEDAAKVCITHSFAKKNVEAIFGEWDCSIQDKGFVRDYLKKCDYNDYDRLIQLCDNLALSDGYCLLEKRMINVQSRYGVNKYSVGKWQAIFDIKDYFEDIIKRPIYSMLPGIAETTFRLEFNQFIPRNSDETVL